MTGVPGGPSAPRTLHLQFPANRLRQAIDAPLQARLLQQPGFLTQQLQKLVGPQLLLGGRVDMIMSNSFEAINYARENLPFLCIAAIFQNRN